jgi:hypothetical protein
MPFLRPKPTNVTLVEAIQFPFPVTLIVHQPDGDKSIDFAAGDWLTADGRKITAADESAGYDIVPDPTPTPAG